MDDNVQQYIDMQKTFYNIDGDLDHYKYNIVSDHWGYSQQQIAGFYSMLFDNQDHSEHVALDFGCGLGRFISVMHDRFKRIDGVDLSSKMLEYAQSILASQNVKNCTLQQNNGYDLSNIADNTYDVVYSVCVLEHIAVHEIRHNYFKEFFRVLKQNGTLAVIMKGGSQYQNLSKSSAWYDNCYDANVTNGGYDVRIDSLLDVANDLFSIGFYDVGFLLTPTPFEKDNDELAGHQYGIRIMGRRYESH